MRRCWGEKQLLAPRVQPLACDGVIAVSTQAANPEAWMEHPAGFERRRCASRGRTPRQAALIKLFFGIPRGFNEFVRLFDVSVLGGQDLANGQGQVSFDGFAVGVDGFVFSFFGGGEQA